MRIERKISKGLIVRFPSVVDRPLSVRLMVRSPYKGIFYIIFILNVITIHLRAPFRSRSF